MLHGVAAGDDLDFERRTSVNVDRPRLLGAWRGPCSSTCIVLSGLAKLRLVALIVALVTAAISPLIAECAQPDACPMQHHACDQTARIADCCCSYSNYASHPGGPVESRVQLAVSLPIPPASLGARGLADIGTGLPFHTSPLSVLPPRVATRCAPLLI